jgi:hypothetical protein
MGLDTGKTVSAPCFLCMKNSYCYITPCAIMASATFMKPAMLAPFT